MSFEPLAFSFISATGGTNKRKDFGFKSTHDAPPNSKVSLIPALPRSRQTSSMRLRSPSHPLPTHACLSFSRTFISKHAQPTAVPYIYSPRDASSLRSACRKLADSSVSAPVSPVPVCTHWLICKLLQSPSLYTCQPTQRLNGSDSSLARILYL